LSRHAEGSSYGQFCPIAMASEIVCSRWTALVLREMMCGSTRFNDLRRGLPRMSPTLLSKRLKELEQAAVVTQRRSSAGGVEYQLTEAGKDLRDVIMSLGLWGHRWIESSISLKNLDPSLLMWDMRRNITPASLPERRCVVHFSYPELGAGRKKLWWLIIEGGKVDLCYVDPGYDVDLHVRSSLRSMTSVWMGITALKAEVDAGNIELSGKRAIARSMHQWLGLSPFARQGVTS
jgi:DNA-binding HxlR family transcriptional regulator